MGNAESYGFSEQEPIASPSGRCADTVQGRKRFSAQPVTPNRLMSQAARSACHDGIPSRMIRRPVSPVQWEVQRGMYI